MREITSTSHALVKHLVKLRESPRYRLENHSVLIYGIKMITELSQVTHIKQLITTHRKQLPPGFLETKVVIANEAILEKITGTKQPEGLAAEVEMPTWSNLASASKVLVLDKITDPGNLGTLLRTAQALAWDGVYLIEGCCDPYNDKALRSAVGATFKIPLAKGPWQQLEQWSSQRGWTPYAADITGFPISSAAQESRLLLVLGSEAHGLSPEARKLCTSITVPMRGEMESLNVSVAGGIIMYLLQENALT